MADAQGQRPGLALVLSGGGARAAYQVGVLRALGARFPALRTPYVTGVSAGAINAAFLAARREPFHRAADRLTELWGNLHTSDVVDTHFGALASAVARWGGKLLSAGSSPAPTRGMVDTEPLRKVLGHLLAGRVDGVDGIQGIRANIEAGNLEAVAVTTTNYSTGQSVTWVEARDFIPWSRPFRLAVNARLSVDHVMASAALPFLFPAVRIGPSWHGDGGIRLTAPLAPALHLGAQRILAIATRRARPSDPEPAGTEVPYPPPAQIAGILLNSVFLDMLDYDALNLGRMNDMLEEMPPERRHGFRRVELLVIRPTLDLGRLAREYEHDLPAPIRFLTRGWGTKELASPDALSMLMFEAGYTRRLMELGEADTTARIDEIARFIET